MSDTLEQPLIRIALYHSFQISQSQYFVLPCYKLCLYVIVKNCRKPTSCIRICILKHRGSDLYHYCLIMDLKCILSIFKDKLDCKCSCQEAGNLSLFNSLFLFVFHMRPFISRRNEMHSFRMINEFNER